MTCEPLVCSLVEDEVKEEHIVTVRRFVAVALTYVTFCQMLTRVVDLFLHQQRLLPAGIFTLSLKHEHTRALFYSEKRPYETSPADDLNRSAIVNECTTCFRACIALLPVSFTRIYVFCSRYSKNFTVVFSYARPSPRVIVSI